MESLLFKNNNLSIFTSSNNGNKLYHYRIAISPPTNFLVKKPTIIPYDEHEFVFEGFSMFTTQKLKDLPLCNVVRFSIKYSIIYLEEKMPDNVTFRELQLFHQYFFKDLLELHDWDIQDRFYFMPRFVRDLPENGKEILSMNVIMQYLLSAYTPVVDEMDLLRYLQMDQMEWQNHITEPLKGKLYLILIYNKTIKGYFIRYKLIIIEYWIDRSNRIFISLA